MKMTMLLADAAQAVGGKLYVLGAGWNFTGPEVPPMALAILVEVPWNATNQKHTIHVELQDSDGQAARIGPEGQVIFLDADLEVGRPPGHPQGTPFNIPFAANLGPLPLETGQRYVWAVSLDGERRSECDLGFNVRPKP